MIAESTKGKMTTAEAAERLGVDHSTVSRWTLVGCNGVVLRGRKIGGRWFYTEDDLAAFHEACNRPGGEERR
ncbi:MAG: helix-turn-helix domain-containing protein [Phycisphaerales bacterium]